MAVDLNELAEKFKKQRALGVARDGRLVVDNPMNDRSRIPDKNGTILEPKRFF